MFALTLAALLTSSIALYISSVLYPALTRPRDSTLEELEEAWLEINQQWTTEEDFDGYCHVPFSCTYKRYPTVHELLALGCDFKVYQVRHRVWHPWYPGDENLGAGVALSDVPLNDVVGSSAQPHIDTSARWYASASVDHASAQRVIGGTQRVGPVQVTGLAVGDAHERNLSASTSGSVSALQLLQRSIEEARQMPKQPIRARNAAWGVVDRTEERYQACLDLALEASDSREALVFREAALSLRQGAKLQGEVFAAVEGYVVDKALEARSVATSLASHTKSAVKTLANAVPRAAMVRRLAHGAADKVWQRVGGSSSVNWRSMSALDLDFDPEAEHVVGLDHFVNLTEVDAIEAAKVLNSSPDSMGEVEKRMEVARQTYKTGVLTAVPPSDPAYATLVRMMGPLAFRPRVQEHKAAATIRRGATAHASKKLEGARVGLISPSNAEIHTFPNAAIWRFNDGAVDDSRYAMHCSLCKTPECQLLAAARADNRVLDDNSMAMAAAFFARFKLQALVLMNVEPNLHATELLKLMVRANIPSAYSLCSLDWRALVVKEAYDALIGMSTSREGGKVVSSFGDGGDYVQPLDNCEALFRPTFAEGYSLRRTIIFGSDASQYYELTRSNSTIATRCVPGHDQYYFLRVPTPEGTDHLLLVERKGFDRVLATYRTQAVRDEEVAKVVLRQSNVTYSIAGTQVTPRIKLSASEAEALAVWVVVYSAVQDVVAKKSIEALSKPSTTSLLSTSIWQGVKGQLVNSTTGQMALGTMSAVEATLGAYRRNLSEKTIDQLSDATFAELFGPKISIVGISKNFFQKWANLSTVVKKAWDMKDKIPRAMITAWRLGFSLVDVGVVAMLLGIRLTTETLGVIVDTAEVVTRLTSATAATARVRQLQGALNWPATKFERVWVAVQDAQKLDFQEASIDIVETFFNLFARDWSYELRESQELAAMDPAELAILQAQADLPYSDFLSEVKRFLCSYNNRVARLAAINKLLHQFARCKREADPSQLSRMVHTLREIAPAAVDVPSELHFALGADATTAPIPLRTIEHGGVDQDIRQTFHENGVLRFTPVNGIASTLERLEVVGGRVDFTPIHEEMQHAHPDNIVNLTNLAGPTSVSPDERGAQLVERLLAEGVNQRLGREFVPQDALDPWYRATMRDPALIEPVERILRESRNLVDLASQPKWIAHLDGLAFGGKSAGVRRWITNADLVVVPTRKLKQEWQTSLGKQDPLHRASVVTQHEALTTKLCAGYVFVDEAYTFDPEHLQLLANRHHASKGLVTIGDGHQIGNVFSPTDNHIDTSLAPIRITAPVSFAPWDALAVYLEHNASPARIERYYCGSTSCEGLRFSLESEDILIPGAGDLAIQGTQNAKDFIKLRGLADALTSHESQGARSIHTVVHGAGEALQRDLRWMSQADQNKHMGVTITRAKEATIFVVGALHQLAMFRWIDVGVAGKLPDECIFGGTAWDLVEPHTVNEVHETYIHEEMLPESSIPDRPLTDPVTIGTIFSHGEALSRSEIRSNVELKDGVRFQDRGIPESDQFDDYTLQPRDIPGVDQAQALTRAVRSAKPTPRDFIDAERIVNRIFDQVIDPKIFFAHLSNSRRNVLSRRRREQVIDGAYADLETRMSTVSWAFLKPEFSKKPSEINERGGELKAQGVITASAMQQALFMDACDSLTHAWARAMRQGKYSPVGFKEQDIDSILSTFDKSFELDLEKQDSSHKAVHVLVACRFLELASDKLGLADVAKEIRAQRSVRMMAEPFEFVLQWALASGDPWTLIFNKIMAVSSLIAVADLTDVRMLQTGDDITLDGPPRWYSREQLKLQYATNRGLTWKKEERSQRREGVTFISRGVFKERTVVYKALRTILKYTHKPRTRLQHESFKVDTKRLKNASAAGGLLFYCHARCKCFGGDPVVVYDMWCRAIALAETPYDNLPAHLRDDSEKPFKIHSRQQGCFGYALAHCVKDNVTAINAIAKYPRVVPTAVAEQACRDNGVAYLKVPEMWAKRSKARLTKAIETWDIKINRPFVALYLDHAIAITPNQIVKHSGVGKVVISWKSLHVDGLDIHTEL